MRPCDEVVFRTVGAQRKRKWLAEPVNELHRDECGAQQQGGAEPERRKKPFVQKDRTVRIPGARASEQHERSLNSRIEEVRGAARHPVRRRLNGEIEITEEQISEQ